MAPLLIGNNQWETFKKQLKEMKTLGVEAVTTDVWWGLVEPEQGKFKWEYYHRIAKTITEAGLKWIPILSTHQCGGNVGDDCSIPIPSWVWKRQFGRFSGKEFHYLSEFGKVSFETISVWGTPWALELYRKFYLAFRDQFTSYAKQMGEINISLGASGELRYPSYNSHDGALAGYPTRGAIQAYSPLAISAFRIAMEKKYKDLGSLNRAWGTQLSKWEEVYPPRTELGEKGTTQFFKEGSHRSAYGFDFFDWYQNSLMAHGRLLLNLAEAVFHEKGSDYSKIPIGAKIPGVHWRAATDRLAELSAGMIRTRGNWKSDQGGHGYGAILSVFRTPVGASAPRILHFSCIEKSDHDDAPRGQSLAKSLVKWVGQEARRQKVVLKGENALAGSLGGEHAWRNMKEALSQSSYSGLTILRMSDVSSERVFPHQRFKQLIRDFSGVAN